MLIRGNAFELLDDVLGGAENPVIVTDPPFNIGYHYDECSDRMPEADYYAFLARMIGAGPCVLVHYPEELYRAAIEAQKPPERVVSWVYPSNTRRQHRDVAFFGIKPDFGRMTQPYRNPNDKRVKKLIAQGRKGAKLYDWWEVNQVKNVSKEKTAHPCQMPELVMERIVGILPDGVTVVDPFMGSGTTGVACARRGVPFIGIELSEAYSRIAEQRIKEASCCI